MGKRRWRSSIAERGLRFSFGSPVRSPKQVIIADADEGTGRRAVTPAASGEGGGWLTKAFGWMWGGSSGPRESVNAQPAAGRPSTLGAQNRIRLLSVTSPSQMQVLESRLQRASLIHTSPLPLGA